MKVNTGIFLQGFQVFLEWKRGKIEKSNYKKFKDLFAESSEKSNYKKFKDLFAKSSEKSLGKRCLEVWQFIKIHIFKI